MARSGKFNNLDRFLSKQELLSRFAISMAVIGAALYIIATFIFSFDNPLFNAFYPKEESLAKGNPHASPTPAPACSTDPQLGTSYVLNVSPNPNTIGGQYTISGGGFVNLTYMTVYVIDSHGTQVLFPPRDAAGNFSITAYSSWPGTSTVQINDQIRNKLKVVTRCTFQVS